MGDVKHDKHTGKIDKQPIGDTNAKLDHCVFDLEGDKKMKTEKIKENKRQTQSLDHCEFQIKGENQTQSLDHCEF